MPSKTRVKSALFLTSFILAGCQALPTPRSDLRTETSSGTPLSEILARANSTDESADLSSDSEPATDKVAISSETSPQAAASETGRQLSIGLSPVPESEVEVTERSTDLAPTRLKTDDQLPPLEAPPEEAQPVQAGTPDFWPEQPVVQTDLEPSAEQTTDNPMPVEPSRLTISQQLNWLPTLDDTLAGMNAQFSDSATLDEKIDSLMSLAYVVDAKLYISFRELLDQLDPQQAQRLMEEQQGWLDQRKENLTRAYLEFKADKAGRYNAAQAFLRNSHARMREIDARLAAMN